MILKFILHFEWHRGYNHNLPRISVKRAPYPGQIVFDKGWGYRKLVMCQPCSGVGYFDAPLSHWSAVEMEQNHPTPFMDDEDVAVAEGRTTWDEEPLRAPETPGLYRLEQTDQGTAFVPQEPVQRQHGPVYTEDTYREMAIEDGDISRWDDEGGNGHNRG